jgi:hypothetical protein
VGRNRTAARFVVLAALAALVLGAAPPLLAPAAATLDQPFTGAFADVEGVAGHGDQSSQVVYHAVHSWAPFQDNYVQLQGIENGHGLDVVVRPPSGSDTISTGTWSGVRATAAPGVPGFGVDTDVGSCTGLVGTLTIDEIQRGDDGAATAFAAHWEVDCPGTGYDRTWFGALSYNSTVDFRSRTHPSVVDFAAAPIASTTSRTVTITNNGPSDLHVASSNLVGADAAQFQVTSDQCSGVAVAAGSSCDIVVGLQPTGSTGPRIAALAFFDDLTSPQGHGQRIWLTGSAAAPLDALGEFTPVTPARILDTRDGTGRAGNTSPVGPGQTIDVAVTGVGGVPAANVAAVVVNVTVTRPTAAGYLTVWPKGVSRPTPSNLNFVPGQDVPNLVTVGVGTDGKVSAFNLAGSTHVIFDVVGWYAASGGAFGSRFHSLFIPYRALDTRNTGTPLGANGTRKLKLPGIGPVPAAGVTGIVVNVTVTQPTASGYVTAYPDDAARPPTSSLNYVPGQTVPNLVVVKVPANGIVDFFNLAGSTHLIVDVMGYFDDDKSTEAGRFLPVVPTRLLDTRLPPPGDPIPPATPLVLGISSGTGIGGIVLNTTVTAPTASGHLIVFPFNASAPNASNLNFVPGQTVPNLVYVGLGFQKQVGFYNSAGFTHLVVDAFGVFTDANFVRGTTAQGAPDISADLLGEASGGQEPPFPTA